MPASHTRSNSGAALDDSDLAPSRVRALARAVETAADGVVLWDEHGDAVFEYGLTIPWLQDHHESVAKILTEIRDVALTGRDTTRTLELLGPPRHSLTVTGIPVRRSDGEASGAVAVLEDNTEDRHLETVRRDFVANVSHELKTPIGALGLLAETLRLEKDSAIATRLIERMQVEAARASQVIDDLLNLSRLEAGNNVTLKVIPVALVIEAATTRVRYGAEHRDITIEVSGPLDATLYAEQREVVSAVQHLLENALKYSNDGSKVEIDVVADGDWTEIAITDHGMGIAAQYLDRIFERFYRVDDARARSSGGTGLGLSLVRHVVHNHGGEVRVTSQEGQGSTFTLRLAAKPSAVSAQMIVEGGTDG